MQTSHQELWAKALNIFKDNVDEQQYKSWFEPIKSLDYSDGTLHLHVPSSYFPEQLEVKFLPLIGAVLKKVYGPEAKLYYHFLQVDGEEDTNVQMRASEQSAAIMQDIKAAPANPFVDQPVKQFDSQLNPKYNFENYCTGTSNNIARTIAESIANDPSNKTFNPLFVFGPVGVGKTHLIQAVGIRIKERNPQARVLYVTARLFQNQYTAANHKGQINNFFHFYQSIDTLIIDDVQDLAGKPETQNTFFHIFNQLHQNNRQIILSSDRAPSEMDGFESRLLSRFKWGASVALDKPDYELRRRVLIKKAEQDGLDLSADIIEYVAENVTESIRELEGVIASMVAQATVLNCEITLDLARMVVAQAIRMRRTKLNFEMITEAVTAYFNMTPDIIFTKNRMRQISDVRQIIMYLTKKLTDMSLKNIGTKFGRTHATVIHGCRNIEDRLAFDAELRNTIDEIKASLNA